MALLRKLPGDANARQIKEHAIAGITKWERDMILFSEGYGFTLRVLRGTALLGRRKLSGILERDQITLRGPASQ